MVFLLGGVGFGFWVILLQLPLPQWRWCFSEVVLLPRAWPLGWGHGGRGAALAWPSVWSYNLQPGACGESDTGTHWEGRYPPAKEGVGSPGQGGLPGAPTRMPPGCPWGPRVARCLVDWGSEPSGSVSSAESLGASGRASASLVRLRRPPAYPGRVPPTPGRSLPPPTAPSPSQEELQGLLFPTEGGSWPRGSPGCDPLSRPSCEAAVRVVPRARSRGLARPLCPPTPDTPCPEPHSPGLGEPGVLVVCSWVRAAFLHVPGRGCQAQACVLFPSSQRKAGHS